jgi:cyclopropane fatty-acyl-phospholipid synthase-like methyltransferase
MAFVFSWGYFNYVSLDTMKQYLRQVFDLLRPGGVFMFSYNDGDTPAGAGMAENFAQTYMPKSMLVTLCESLGYNVSSTHIHSTNIHWIEITKPGVLETNKAHQVLGKIEPITL